MSFAPVRQRLPWMLGQSLGALYKAGVRPVCAYRYRYSVLVLVASTGVLIIRKTSDKMKTYDYVSARGKTYDYPAPKTYVIGFL